MLSSSASASMSLLLTLLLCRLSSQSSSADTSTLKRGIAYVNTSTPQDYNIFINKPSPLHWYFNWSPFPNTEPSSFSHLEFVPQITDTNNLTAVIAQIASLPASTTHVLTFNEPDIGPAGGGSLITPGDAAKAYLEYIVPLTYINRTNGGSRFQISHPVTTSTLSGISWLSQFNASCWAINITHGCHTDFVATHYYGDYSALQLWVNVFNGYYNPNTTTRPKVPIWFTEFAFQQNTVPATINMMNLSMPYLDNLDYVARYAWFGFFRTTNANTWTWSAVSLLNEQGSLTDLGAMYLGGNSSGFYANMSATSSNWPNTTSTTGAGPTATGKKSGATRSLGGVANWNFMLGLLGMVAMAPYLMIG